MQFYLKNSNEVLKEVKSNENGLTSDEAKSRLETNGKNKLQEPPKDSLFKKFIKSLADPMIIML
ncbi:MAG: cation-transporting P-type ATPase, partial [Clostridia bacterium]